MPTCFVVQGFGKKTDFESGRVLDLDASYEVIKEAVEAAGYECVRADEIKHSRNIDQVMYEQLLAADLVIADISTSNANAFYELGVRFGLRPYSTIVVSENRITFPFDINHIPIHTYEHLGNDIGRREATRFIAELKELIETIGANDPMTDSPVYTFLKALEPTPFEKLELAQVAVADRDAPETSLADLKRQAHEAMEASNFETAVRLWREVREQGPKDDYVVQQLALAIYKSKHPSEAAALAEAREALESLWPEESLDPETLGLWAAIHKRLYETQGDAAALDKAITASEKGFILRRDYYNGINLAFSLDTGACLAAPELAQEDHARAQSARRRVIEICETKLGALEAGSDERYWVLATLEEAAVGLGDEEAAARWHTEAVGTMAADWKLRSTAEQIEKVRALLVDLRPKLPS